MFVTQQRHIARPDCAEGYAPVRVTCRLLPYCHAPHTATAKALPCYQVALPRVPRPERMSRGCPRFRRTGRSRRCCRPETRGSAGAAPPRPAGPCASPSLSAPRALLSTPTMSMRTSPARTWVAALADAERGVCECVCVCMGRGEVVWGEDGSTSMLVHPSCASCITALSAYRRRWRGG